MKKGGNRLSAKGFTIVETLIVLAVTTALFASVIVVVNGRQGKTEFTVAINGLQQKFQQIMNQTASGYYPNTSNFSCTGHPGVGSSGPTFSTVVGTNADQGTNGSCIFIGNSIRLGDGHGSDSATTYTVYPLAGNRLGPDTISESINIAQARPVAISPTSGSDVSVPDDSTTNSLGAGLSFLGASVGPTYTPGGSSVVDFAAVTTFGSYSNGGTLNSGSQKIQLYGYDTASCPGWIGASNSYDIASAIKAAGVCAASSPTTAGFLPLPTGLTLCFASGGSNQSGLITIGGNNSSSVTLQLKTGKTC